MSDTATRWLLNEGVVVSEFGSVVADILAELYDGIYHLDGLHNVSFAGDYIQVPIHGYLSSYDWDHLTRLVVLAHDRCVRVEVKAEMRMGGEADDLHEFPTLVLGFSKRERMERGPGPEGHPYWYYAHPTMEEAIEHVRKVRSIA
jgi:hypothetical protein